MITKHISVLWKEIATTKFWLGVFDVSLTNNNTLLFVYSYKSTGFLNKQYYLYTHVVKQKL